MILTLVLTSLPVGLDASNNPIINVQDPTNAQDAVTKKYVDGLHCWIF